MAGGGVYYFILFCQMDCDFLVPPLSEGVKLDLSTVRGEPWEVAQEETSRQRE